MWLTSSNCLSTTSSYSSSASSSANASRVCAVFSALAFWRASSFALLSWSEIWKVLQQESFHCLVRRGDLPDLAQWVCSSRTSSVEA
jgi:hypothetical protein